MSELTELARYCNPGIPKGVCILISSSFIIACVFIGVLKGIRDKVACYKRVLIIWYIIIILSSTIFCRFTMPFRELDFFPFHCFINWIENGVCKGYWELVMNVLLFVPLGFLIALGKQKLHFRHVVYIGMSLSIIIETSQYIFAKGISQIDDIINNTIGCIIGYVIGRVLMKNNYKQKRTRYAKD